VNPFTAIGLVKLAQDHRTQAVI